MKFYKRNAQGKPIFWEISDSTNKIVVTYGLVGKLGHTTEIRTNRQLNEEIKSQIISKQKKDIKLYQIYMIMLLIILKMIKI